MSLKLTVFVCLFTNFLFSHRGYEAVPVTSKLPSIVDVIVTDTNIYNSTRETARNSKYLEECRKVDFPEKFIKLTDKNLNEFLCLAIYDGFVKIGHYDNCTEGSRMEENASVLNNQVIFESAIETTLKSYKNNPWNFCGNLINISLPVFNGTKDFIAQLEPKFTKTKPCVDICADDSPEEINPLCVVLEIIDQQLRAKAEHSKSGKKGIKQIPVKSSNFQNKNDLKIAKTGEEDPEINSNSHTTINAEAKHTTNKVGTSESKTVKTADGAMIDKTKISSDNPPSKSNVETSDHNNDAITKLKVKPGELSMKNKTGETEQSPLNVPNMPKENDGAPEISKSTTISGKTLDEDQGDRSPEYNADMTDENDQVSDPDNGDMIDDVPNPITKQNQQPEIDPIDQQENIPHRSSMQKEDDSHFFGYFTIIGLIGISACLIYHHKQKILAMIVEGRRSRGDVGERDPVPPTIENLTAILKKLSHHNATRMLLMSSIDCCQ